MTDLDAYVAESLSLREHLAHTAVLLADPAERMIAAALIDGVDDSGYFVGSLIEIAERLGASADIAERLLIRMQGLEPTGVFAETWPNAWRFNCANTTASIRPCKP